MSPAQPGTLPTAEELAGRVAAVRREIAEHSPHPERVEIVAVTKGFPAAAWGRAAAAGLGAVGENYADELLAKAAGVDLLPEVHFIGALQRNKVARLAPVVEVWQTVSRLVEGVAIARHRPGARVFVQVDHTGRPGRNGCDPGEAGELAAGLADLGLHVAGLMTVAPPEPEAAREAFAATATRAAALGLEGCSMGMSGDYRAALEEGSTLLRLGRTLFGERPARIA